MVMSMKAYNQERADEKQSEAARRGAVTRENREKARFAWLKKYRREHEGRDPSPEEWWAAKDRIKREVTR